MYRQPPFHRCRHARHRLIPLQPWRFTGILPIVPHECPHGSTIVGDHLGCCGRRWCGVALESADPTDLLFQRLLPRTVRFTDRWRDIVPIMNRANLMGPQGELGLTSPTDRGVLITDHAHDRQSPPVAFFTPWRNVCRRAGEPRLRHDDTSRTAISPHLARFMAFLRWHPINGEDDTTSRVSRCHQRCSVLDDGGDQRQTDLTPEGDLCEGAREIRCRLKLVSNLGDRPVVTGSPCPHTRHHIPSPG